MRSVTQLIVLLAVLVGGLTVTPIQADATGFAVVAESASPGTAEHQLGLFPPGIAELYSACPAPYRSGLGSVADSATVLPVGTGVSSARVEAFSPGSGDCQSPCGGLAIPPPRSACLRADVG